MGAMSSSDTVVVSDYIDLLALLKSYIIFQPGLKATKPTDTHTLNVDRSISNR